MLPMRKGQSATEWIVILAVILVLALLVAVLMNSSARNAGDFNASRSKSYWA